MEMESLSLKIKHTMIFSFLMELLKRENQSEEELIIRMTAKYRMKVRSMTFMSVMERECGSFPVSGLRMLVLK